jgi:hypothetical protein
MTPVERETILRTDDASDPWTVWSAKGSRQARRLLKRCTPVREDATGWCIRGLPPRMWTVSSAKCGFLPWHMARRMPPHVHARRRLP